MAAKEEAVWDDVLHSLLSDITLSLPDILAYKLGEREREAIGERERERERERGQWSRKPEMKLFVEQQWRETSSDVFANVSVCDVCESVLSEGKMVKKREKVEDKHFQIMCECKAKHSIECYFFFFFSLFLSLSLSNSFSKRSTATSSASSTALCQMTNSLPLPLLTSSLTLTCQLCV